MGTLQEQMVKAGFKLSEEEQKKVKGSLTTLKKKLRTSTCRQCGASVKFVELPEGRTIPHNLDGVPHWQTCPYKSFAQRKSAVDIMKKLAVLFVIKQGLNLEEEAGLTEMEVKIVHATLERMFKEESSPVKKAVESIAEGDSVKNEDIQFKPEPCDSVGDPDEERAPSEDLVTNVEKDIIAEKSLDKGVEKAIFEKK